ncbi:uncharacterized protein LOC133519647 [Cydia pomonella]|uniref:uncharacterized protein LOC133519647 n=1 Tax=Cydia pomonella TaxID=82600 RepID=UPI002ADDC2C9|nr:uncharacterized protein LOC133519647 [Cydia pomonella]
MLKMGVCQLMLVLLLGWITDTKALKDVQLIAPSAVRLGDEVQLGCKWTLEGNETLYSVKWYRGRQEFFSYLPKEYPFTRIFPQPGIDVDVSIFFILQNEFNDRSSLVGSDPAYEADGPVFKSW